MTGPHVESCGYLDKYENKVRTVALFVSHFTNHTLIPALQAQPTSKNVLRKNAEGRLVVGVTCYNCRLKTYAITGVEEARKEDRRLVMDVLRKFHVEEPFEEEKEDGVKVFKALRWVNDFGNFVPKFVKDPRWQTERFRKVLPEDEMVPFMELAKKYVRHV